MAYKSRIVIAVVLLGLIAFGCNGTQDRSTSKVGLAGAEETKAKLLKEIQRKYENPEAHYELGKLYLADGL
jgi:hypothetical protein